MINTLYLIRGLPGAGKTSLVKSIQNSFASHITSEHIEADQYFYMSGEYKWNPDLIGKAHASCKLRTMKALSNSIQHIFVSNTFTTEKEMIFYFAAAETYDYRIVTLIVENRHGKKSIHNVPDETVSKMKNRFSINL